MLDVAIVGSGPAGIKAAISLFDQGYNIALIEKGAPGGKLNVAPLIVNYPGIESVTGPDLAVAMFSDIFYKGIKFINEEVMDFKKVDDHYEIQTRFQKLEAKSILLATGTKEKMLGLTHDKDWIGKGVSYCALCDGHFYRNKIVGVIVGDNHALKEALYLTKLAETVYVISDKDNITGDIRSYSQLIQKENVRFLFNKTMIDYIGNDFLQGIKLKDNITNKVDELMLDGLFPLIGCLPNTEFIKADILNKDGCIIVNENMETSLPGVYAAGDVLARKVHQIVLAEMDAKKAVDSIKKYLESK